MICKTILIIGNFAKWAIENYYADNFKKLNYKVLSFDIIEHLNDIQKNFIKYKLIYTVNENLLYKKLNKNLIEFVYKNKPDIVLIFKGTQIYPDTICEIKNLSKLIINYNPDHPIIHFAKSSGNRNIIKSIKYYDIYFSYSQNIVDKLKKEFNVESHWIPFGYNEQINLSTLSVGENHLLKYKDNFMFIAHLDLNRLKILKKINVNNILIYGNYSKYSKIFANNFLRKMINGELLLGSEYAIAISVSKGILNFLRDQNMVESSHNMRTFEVPAYGGLLITNRTEEQLYFFDEDKEAIYFNDLNELNEKLDYLNKHPNTIAKIKSNAYQKCISLRCSYKDRTREMIEVIHNKVN